MMNLIVLFVVHACLRYSLLRAQFNAVPKTGFRPYHASLLQALSCLEVTPCLIITGDWQTTAYFLVRHVGNKVSV